MSVVCGTDLSVAAGRAEVAAAHLASRLGVKLHLVHAVDLGADELYEEPRSAVVTWARRHLDRTAIRLRQGGSDVQVHVLAGPPDEVMVQVVREVGGELLVVSPHGARPPRRGRLGSHTERVARESPVPVLVVRHEAPFVEWAMTGRPLKILVGVDFSATTAAALGWVGLLCRSGPCEVTAAHVYWPPGEIRRLGLRGRPLVDPDPEVEATLERDLAEKVAELGGASRVRVEAFLGRVADRLINVAGDEQADLIVVGAHQKGALARLWEGSVSRDLMQNASQSVVSVPGRAEARDAALRALRTVVVATDFSEIGDAAVPLAYAAAADGGTVHLVHVIPAAEGGAESARAARRTAESQLEALIPAGSGDRVVTEVHVLPGGDAAREIGAAAERLGADLVCVGTHGRTGLRRAVLGSVAQAVLASTRRPVLLARPPPP